MKKRLLFAAMALAMLGLITSCAKYGWDKEFDGLKHPMQIHGTFDPNLGVPLGTAEITVKEMLTMLNVQQGVFIYDENTNLMSVVYRDTSENVFAFGNNNRSARHNSRNAWKPNRATLSPSGNSKGNEVVIYSDVVSGAVGIDLFNNVDIENYNIRFNGVKATLKANAKGIGTLSAQTIADHGLRIYIDSLHIDAFGRDGARTRVPFLDSVYDLGGIMSPSGQNVTLLDNTDVTELLNICPTGIRYIAKLNIAIDEDHLVDWGLSLGGPIDENFISDSLKIDSIDVVSVLGAEIPMSIHFENLGYEADIDYRLNTDFKVENLKLNDSYIGVAITNGTPLEYTLSATFTDSLGNVLCPLFQNDTMTVRGATIRLNPNNDGSYITNTAYTEDLHVMVTERVFRAMMEAKNIHVSATLKTSQTNADPTAVVAIKGTDKLSVRVYAVLHPGFDITIPISGGRDKE